MSIIYYADSLASFSDHIDGDTKRQNGDPYDAGLPRIPDTISIFRGTVQQTEHILKETELVGEIPGLNASLIVFGDGCGFEKDTSGKPRDCAEACTDPGYLFASWETQWTCLTLASLAVAWPLVSINASAETTIDETVRQADGNDISDFDGERVFDIVRDCAAAGCRAGECSVEYSEPSDRENATQVLQQYFSGLERACDGLQVSASNDIAGPGVIASYTTQTALCVFSWLSIIIVAIWRNDDKRRTTQHRHRDARDYEPVQDLQTTAPNRPQRHQQTLGSRISHASSTLLVEFQEAQCFFIVALAIAQLYSDSQSAAFSDADSLGSLLFQYDRVIILAALGMQCIALTQAGLRHAHLGSFYSLFWATLAAGFAAAAGAMVIPSDVELVNKFFRESDEPGVKECGGNASLRQLCLADIVRFDIESMLVRATSVVMITLVLLWLDASIPLMVGPKRRWSKEKTMSETLGILLAALPAVIQAILVVLELLLVAFTLISCIEMTKPTLASRNGPWDSWTIGQIIAMLIWAPIISKYIYLVIFGIEKGFEMRMSPDYGVHHKADQATLVDRATKYDRAQESQNGGLS